MARDLKVRIQELQAINEGLMVKVDRILFKIKDNQGQLEILRSRAKVEKEALGHAH